LDPSLDRLLGELELLERREDRRVGVNDGDLELELPPPLLDFISAARAALFRFSCTHATFRRLTNASQTSRPRFRSK
jgi:hypothetical protein